MGLLLRGRRQTLDSAGQVCVLQQRRPRHLCHQQLLGLGRNAFGYWRYAGFRCWNRSERCGDRQI